MHPFVFTTGQHRIFNGSVELELKLHGCHIHRIEVDAAVRRTGEATRILKFLSDKAQMQNISLSACVCPDDPDYAVTLGLRRAFASAGFVSYEEDGEVYPNDVLFFPCRVAQADSLSIC